MRRKRIVRNYTAIDWARLAAATIVILRELKDILWPPKW